MKTHGNSSIESHKIFPYIAWALFVGFSLFTIHLAYELYQATDQIAKNTSRLEILANDNSERIEKLEIQLTE